MGRILKRGRLNPGMVINTHLVTLDEEGGFAKERGPEFQPCEI